MSLRKWGLKNPKPFRSDDLTIPNHQRPLSRIFAAAD